jgi:flagellar FliJ protein
MKWTRSLIKISNHEVETIQKRVAEIVARRWAIEMQIAAIEEELKVERDQADSHAETGFYMVGFEAGAKRRRETLEASLVEIEAEERGARDALSEAFETLKKYEKVAEAAKEAEARYSRRTETAAYDEIGLRRRK